MRSYEVMFIVKPDLSEEETTAVIEKFKNLIVKHGGEVTAEDRWGLRKLAYEIQKYREGYYVVMKFKAPAEFSRELDRVLRITDEVMRHIIIREDE
ncbi:MAG: small subunit ribosomal protein [Eubacteriales bacterium]|nr:small subunit ribosomal protein [Eubacteriales bacterium]